MWLSSSLVEVLQQHGLGRTDPSRPFSLTIFQFIKLVALPAESQIVASAVESFRSFVLKHGLVNLDETGCKTTCAGILESFQCYGSFSPHATPHETLTDE